MEGKMSEKIVNKNNKKKKHTEQYIGVQFFRVGKIPNSRLQELRIVGYKTHRTNNKNHFADKRKSRKHKPQNAANIDRFNRLHYRTKQDLPAYKNAPDLFVHRARF